MTASKRKHPITKTKAHDKEKLELNMKAGAEYENSRRAMSKEFEHPMRSAQKMTSQKWGLLSLNMSHIPECNC
jgi:hypothetical protein